MKPVLSKPFAWPLLIILVFIDAILDIVMAGSAGSPLWRYIANFFRIPITPLFFALVVLAIFYFAVKTLGWLVQKTDKTPRSEELILSILVVVYGFFDVWLVSRYFFGFSLVKDHRLLIIPLTIIGMIYGLWAQQKLKINTEIKI